MQTPLSEEELTAEINFVLSAVATQNHAELGWIWSSTRHAPNYPGQAALNTQIQARIDNAIGGMTVIYLFALLESHIDRKFWEYAEEIHRERMYAYLHVRNTAAHGFDGQRAERYFEQFNIVMSSTTPISGIRHFNETHILLDSNVWMGLQDLIPKFLMSILKRVVNYGY